MFQSLSEYDEYQRSEFSLSLAALQCRYSNTKKTVTLQDTLLVCLIQTQLFFCPKLGLLVLSPITSIGKALGGALFMASIGRKNDYSEENVFQFTYGHRTTALRQS